MLKKLNQSEFFAWGRLIIKSQALTHLRTLKNYSGRRLRSWDLQGTQGYNKQRTITYIGLLLPDFG